MSRCSAALVVSVAALVAASRADAGDAQDAVQAARLDCRAARTGDMEAQWRLGLTYSSGRGVARDEPIAALFFMLAAQQGHEDARRMLRSPDDATSAVPDCINEAIAVETAVPDRPLAPQPAPEEIRPFVAVTPAQKKALDIVNRLAADYGVTPRLAIAVIRAESNFDPAARSEKNAQGLMQLIPQTSTRFNVAKPFDPVQNVRGGLAYLRWLLAYFQGDVALVAAAYNAGEGAVDRYRGIPPFRETRAYVKRVVEFYGRAEHPYDATVTEPSPELVRPKR